MENSQIELRQKIICLRQRMLKHQEVGDTAVVVLAAQELDELLSFIEGYLD